VADLNDFSGVFSSVLTFDFVSKEKAIRGSLTTIPIVAL